jgi:hypothetical protein
MNIFDKIKDNLHESEIMGITITDNDNFGEPLSNEDQKYYEKLIKVLQNNIFKQKAPTIDFIILDEGMISVNFDNRSFNSVDNNIALRLTKYISD